MKPEIFTIRTLRVVRETLPCAHIVPESLENTMIGSEYTQITSHLHNSRRYGRREMTAVRWRKGGDGSCTVSVVAQLEELEHAMVISYLMVTTGQARRSQTLVISMHS